MHRRTVLATAAAVGASSLAGCLGTSDSDESVPDPVSLSGTKYDYQGGMVIGSHGGPNGQLFYADEQPQQLGGSASFQPVHEGHEDDDSGGGSDSDASTEHLAWFHTLVHGLFPYHFSRRDRGWTADVIYVTDYSRVDWELPEDDSRPVMPSPTTADTFADATDLTYVGDSDVMGGMGPALHPFSDQSEAASFAETYNGTRYEFDDITRSLIDSLQDSGTMS